MAAILKHLKLGCGGNKCAILFELFMNVCLSRLNLRGSCLDKKNLQAKPRKLLWWMGPRFMEEMYVLYLICAKDTDFVIIGFEAEIINLLHTLVFWKSPTKYTT